MISKATAKYIQSLKHKKQRDEDNLFVAEGPKLINDLLQSELKLNRLFATVDFAEQAAVTDRVSQQELERISFLTNPNQALAIFEKPATGPIKVNNKLTLCLDGIQDPGNLGTIIRTAHWFGIQNIVCSPDTADAFNPKVVQGTMASIAHMHLHYMPLPPWLGTVSVPKLAAALQGKPLQDFRGMREAVIIMGNEGKGISPEVLSLADHHLTIPRIGSAESLNAAVATAIILYAFAG